MIYEFRQQNSGGSGQKNMPLVIYIVCEYAHEANELLKEYGGYFGRKEGDCPEKGDSCCGDRWEPVEQADGFIDEEIDHLVEHMIEDQEYVHMSGTFIDEEPYNGIEEFWVIRKSK